MKMRILSIAYPFAEVSVDSVGGAEQVLATLDRALVAQGHESYVIASSGSQIDGTLISLEDVPAPITDWAREQVYDDLRWHVQSALERHSIDLIHLHGIDFPHYIPPGAIPALVTLHLPLAWYSPEAFASPRSNLFLHGVSESQVRTAPETARLLKPIGNGVALEQFAPTSSKGDFALCLGRICPEKGYHLAIDAATRAGMPLVLAGKVYPYEAHENYYRSEIEPRLGPAVSFIGPANFARKRHLLSAARCLLVPSLVSETSSLAAMESLASGTPVIAFRAGALPEIIEHGKTGFIVDSADEMAEALRMVDVLKSDDCRESARERFDLRQTVAGYFALYRELIARCAPVSQEVCNAA